MTFKRVTGGVTIAAVLAIATPSVAHAQDRDWHDGYSWGEHDGYGEGRYDGYRRGSVDGYHRGHSDGYAQAVRDGDDDDDAYVARPYRPRCQRSDGTGGTIIGAVAGGLLGRHVSRDRVAGALIGGGIGALAGRAIDRAGQTC